MNDRVLHQHPDFVLRRSPTLTTIFVMLAVVVIIGLIASLVFAGDLSNQQVSWRGRSSDALGGIVVPGAVVICGFFAFLFIWLAKSQATCWVRVSTAAALRGFELRASGDAGMVAELHRRLSTGDPAVYLPIPVSRRGDVRVRVYRADADRSAFVTVQLGAGPSARTWPLIELQDRGYVQIRRRTPKDFARPYAP